MNTPGNEHPPSRHCECAECKAYFAPEQPTQEQRPGLTLIMHKDCGGTLFFYDHQPARDELVSHKHVTLRDGKRPAPDSAMNITCERCGTPVNHIAQCEPFGGYAGEQLPHHPV